MNYKMIPKTEIKIAVFNSDNKLITQLESLFELYNKGFKSEVLQIIKKDSSLRLGHILELSSFLKPDIIIFNIEIDREMSVFQIIGKIRQDDTLKRTPIILITEDVRDEYVCAAFIHNINCLLDKSEIITMIDMINAIINGNIIISKHIQTKIPNIILNLVNQPKYQALDKYLDEKEKTIWQAKLSGKSRLQISTDLNMSINTVKYYLKKISKKSPSSNNLLRKTTEILLES
jgi:DNA-binding NarL/FixJ family response regulator